MTRAVRLTDASLAAMSRRGEGAHGVSFQATVPGDALLSLVAEAQVARAHFSKLADTWARYQRRDLSQEEFEGTVAEIAEASDLFDPPARTSSVKGGAA